VNELGCVGSPEGPEGSGVGCVVSGCNSVEEVEGGKKKNRHPQEENGEGSSSGITLISGNICYIIINLGRRQPV